MPMDVNKNNFTFACIRGSKTQAPMRDKTIRSRSMASLSRIDVCLFAYLSHFSRINRGYRQNG